MNELFELYPVSMCFLSAVMLVVFTVSVAGVVLLIQVLKENKRLGV